MQMMKNSHAHRKPVVVEDFLERYITIEDRGIAPSMPLKNSGANVSRHLNPMRLAEVRKCPECRLKPVLFLTKKKIPVCAVHWAKLADAQIGWSEDG